MEFDTLSIASQEKKVNVSGFLRQPLSCKQVKFTSLNESSKASDMFLMIIPQRTMLYSRRKYSMEL